LDDSNLTVEFGETSDSSATEGPDVYETTNYVTSEQTPGKPMGGSSATSPLSPLQDDAGLSISQEASISQASISRASQLLSNDNTFRDSSTASELAAELSVHKLKLQEEVVEGVGEKEIEKGLGDQEEIERIETNFEDEAEKSPNKRAFDQIIEAQMSEAELTDVEDNIVTGEDNTTSGEGGLGLPHKRARVSDPDLPHTVQLLVSKLTGTKVYLIGTAHFSKESCDDVSRIIQAVQPDIVMVELCKQRTNILHLDEETILAEAQNLSFERSLEIIKSQGTLQGVMYLLLLSMSAHITKELGMAPGGEFRRAYIEAQNVPRCMVHLGDRPIGITLQRALGSLSLWQKVKLGFNILTSKDSITKEDVEKCKQRDLLENMLAEMAGEFPGLSRVFVSERDLFLAHSLQMASDSIPPMAVSPRVVVGVVGIGHVPGIVENWGKVTKDQIREIVTVNPPSRAERALKIAFKTVLLGSFVYGAYRLARIPISRFITSK